MIGSHYDWVNNRADAGLARWDVPWGPSARTKAIRTGGNAPLPFVGGPLTAAYLYTCHLAAGLYLDLPYVGNCQKVPLNLV